MSVCMNEPHEIENEKRGVTGLADDGEESCDSDRKRRDDRKRNAVVEITGTWEDESMMMTTMLKITQAENLSFVAYTRHLLEPNFSHN